MNTISLRGIDNELKQRLQEEAGKKQSSVNSLILSLLRESMGMSKTRSRYTGHHDLDALAGTWSEEEAREFLASVEAFEEIEEHLWR